ncbi:uncharacterized protein (TIGR01777 family) [Leucobacter exalbidus]|uniref:Uncharacterized protein (TIGR01777 family) n=1 Tax=Leucobacter exalbidus TaxID=662960 RepID=A0A940PMP0_9MICO|nr:TIGR01777 family oxidoreductase [Leucobacter exalbidus]MBP1326767.1 uncharacterized protein (TIGR01777 family) [Leucobacter exalbidus]
MNSRIVISGASGLIGRAFTDSLRSDGIDVIWLVRRPAENPTEVEWHPGAHELDPGVLDGASAVVNLNGASIGKLPWTKSYRETLLRSRVLPTRTLATALRALGPGAPMFLSASAVGIYGSQPGLTLTEASNPGDTFLAQLTARWEREALEAGPEVPVALLRTASILHPQAVLKPLIPLARFGLLGPLGSGRQIWPWISLEDEVRAIRHILQHRITGPVNLTGPEPASATTIGRHLARRMHRPFLVPAPAWALRLGLGRTAADSLLLADARVQPRVLTKTGFSFTHATAAGAIDAALTDR